MLSINVIADHISLERCKELLFLHALSGSDYTSSFYQVGKVKFWNSWLSNTDISQTFLTFSDSPSLPLSDEALHVVERFIVSLYTNEPSYPSSIDLARYEIFKYRGNLEMRSLPPTRDALVQHIHKAAYVSGYIWGRSHLTNTTDEPLSNWTWNLSGGKICCVWLSSNTSPLSEDLSKKAFRKCGCRKKCTKICSCRKQEIRCLPNCKCRRNCGSV